MALDSEREHITSGPRWDCVVPAVEKSIRIVKKKGKGQGWIKAMLDSYQDILRDLTEGGHVQDSYIHYWVRGEYWDPRGNSG